jgi:hypothetical protein
MQEEQRARMKKDRKTRRRSQDGIALLIAIFVLLLISVVAIALLVSSGTETALGANYRTSSTVYYAAIAGLEEARGRLLPKNPNYFLPANIPTPFPLGQTLYVINQLPGENIVPWDSTNPYYDKEYGDEAYPLTAASAAFQSVNSVWDNNIQGIPGPIFKWVRINAATEQSLFLQVNASGSYNNNTPIYYDPFHFISPSLLWPSLVVGSTPTAVQALEVTAMASLPNGSKKILQYLVAPVTPSLTFPAALTMDGYSNFFSGPDHNLFQISGNNDSSDPACSTMPYPVAAIGVPDQVPDVNYVINGNPGPPPPASTGIPGSQIGNFTGTPGPSPNVVQVTLPTNMQNVQSLNQIAQTIIQNADSVISDPAGIASSSNLPAAMSNTNPMTIAVQGDPTQPNQGNFTLNPGFTGYGLLLVTGNFTYATNSNWNGIVLVIGQGTVTASESGPGGLFSGAMLVAQTRDLTGNLLSGPNPGPARFTDTLSGSVGRGIYYNCTWIQKAQAPLTYKVLSFHEIRQ